MQLKIKNKKVFYLSLIALFFMVLTVLVNWIFIIGAVIIIVINQKELLSKKNLKKNQEKNNKK